MRPPSISSKFTWLFLCLFAIPVSLQARTLHAEIAAVRTGAGELRQVVLEVQWPDGATQGELRLSAGVLEVPVLDYRATAVAWRCPLSRREDGAWTCDGALRVAGGRPSRLSLVIASASTDAILAIGKTRIGYESRADVPDLSRIRLEAVPVAWLKAFLARMWAEGQWSQGQLGGHIDLRAPTEDALEVAAKLKIAGLNLETPDGSLAAAGLGGTLDIDYRSRGRDTRVKAQVGLRGGELLAGDFYAILPASTVTFAVSAESLAGAPWRLPSLSWRDGEVLQASGSASLDAESSVRDLQLDLSFGDLGQARDRYLSGFLSPAGFPDLILSGRARAGLRYQQGALAQMQLELGAVNIIDPRQRFTLAGLDGGLNWTAGSAAVTSRLAWTSGALYGIGLGAAELAFLSRDGELALSAPTRVAVLEGGVTLDQLRWQAPKGEQGTRFQLGVTMADLDLASLSQRLGWPPFTGSLGGRIPSARFEKGVLTLDGGLQMQLFGGTVSLSELVMERPFGVAPTLSADVALADLDLEPLTGAFGFGAITGRLDGSIKDLRLVDWSPVAFHARLQSDDRWKGKRRISQRAVQDISRVGGSGLIAGLQGQVLKYFDDFGYARIAWGCRLRDNVCTMEGVDSAGDGYTIVEGAGLPRIQVVGFRRRVDWPTLVARLEAATAGQSPIIQ